MPKLLLSGFEPFPGVELNPSGVLVREIPAVLSRRNVGFDLVTQILPTEFNVSARLLVNTIRSEKPDAVIMLGVGSPGPIQLEHLARNQDAPDLPDAAGLCSGYGPLIARGPDSYFSTLAITEIRSALEEAGLPVNDSNDAGGYVCNHLFYLARHELATATDVPCGFIHIPVPAEWTGQAGMSIDEILQAVLIILDVTSTAISGRRQDEALS